MEAKVNKKFLLPSLKGLSGKICLCSSVQYIDSLPGIKAQLENNGVEVVLFKSAHSNVPGQILGCDVSYVNSDFDAFLFVGDGMFHPKALLLKNEKKVFAFNPILGEVKEVVSSDIEKLRKRVKGRLLKFYDSKNIGILVSTKPGQHNMDKAIAFKLHFKDKNCFIFVDNEFNFSKLEDFNFIDCYVNTACPRIGYDDSIRLEKPIINIGDVEWN